MSAHAKVVDNHGFFLQLSVCMLTSAYLAYEAHPRHVQQALFAFTTRMSYTNTLKYTSLYFLLHLLPLLSAILYADCIWVTISYTSHYAHTDAHTDAAGGRKG